MIIEIYVRLIYLEVNSVLVMLYSMDVGDVVDVLQLYAVFIFRFENWGSIYFLNVGNITHIHMV